MKITKRQLRKLIREAIDIVSETQEEDPKFLELVEAFRDVIQDANRLGLNEQDIEDAYFSALDEAGFSTANRGN